MSTLAHFLESDINGVFYIGHASALVRINRKLYAFDPVWNCRPYGKHWQFVPEQIDCDRLRGRLSAVFISHIHEDHLNDKILRELDAPVEIMGGRWDLIDRLNGTQLSTHKPFEWVEIDPGVWAYFVKHPTNSVDSSVFLRSDDYCVYVGSDNFLDHGKIEHIRPFIPRVHVAMVPYAFIHYYPWLLDTLTDEEKQEEGLRLKTQALAQAVEFIDTFRPSVAIPFGASLMYAHGADHRLNSNVATPMDLQRAARKVGFNHTQVKALLPGDYLLGTTAWQPFAEQGMAEYQHMLRNHLGYDQGPPLDLLFNPEELFHCPPEHRHDIGHEVSINGCIVATGSQSMHRFDFDREVFTQWANGEINFEQALGTRRFRYLRSPNEYVPEVFEWANHNL